MVCNIEQKFIQFLGKKFIWLTDPVNFHTVTQNVNIFYLGLLAKGRTDNFADTLPSHVFFGQPLPHLKKLKKRWHNWKLIREILFLCRPIERRAEWTISLTASPPMYFLADPLPHLHPPLHDFTPKFCPPPPSVHWNFASLSLLAVNSPSPPPHHK